MQWKASAIAQSGFKIEGKSALHRYYKAVVSPPYRGVFATVLGMTWARATIFYGSDFGKLSLAEHIYIYIYMKLISFTRRYILY